MTSRPGSGGTLAVTGGTVVTPGGTRQADVLIRHGTIVALAGAGAAPAAAIRRGGEIGTLAPGSVADLTGFELRAGGWLLPDGAGQSEVVETLVIPRLVVRAGRVHRLEPVIRGAVP